MASEIVSLATLAASVFSFSTRVYYLVIVTLVISTSTFVLLMIRAIAVHLYIVSLQL